MSGSAAAIETLFAEGVRQHQAGKLAEAVSSYRQALVLHPEPAARGALCCNLGHALLSLYRRSEALPVCKQAVALLPESVEALANFGNLLLELGRIEEARHAYEAALKRNPNWLPAIHNLGTVAMEEGRFDLARAACERALTLDPGFADARLNRGILRLLHGEFSDGWEDYEARLVVRRTMTPRPSADTPQWRGEPLNGDSILLYSEQGLGDAIQFLRYVPQVVAGGGRVTLLLPSRLVRLAEGLGASLIVPSELAGERSPECQWQCPLMSLPLALARQSPRSSDSWAVPAWKPYLTVPAEEGTRAQRFARPPDTLRVGLVWAGTPDHTRDWARSVPLDLLAPLFTLSGVQFYSLQAGLPASQIKHWSAQIIDLKPLEHDMADVAAKILELDLVIAADTSVAHLAGALGKSVWLLLPCIPDWRWQLDREDSPWYPRMRLFRQQERHAWQPVITRLGKELHKLVESGWRERTEKLEVLTDTPSEAPLLLKAADTTDDQSGSDVRHPLPLAVVSTDPRPCKIRHGSSPLFGVADFHKSCMEGQGRRLALSGIPVYYRRCEQCGFISTDFFDAWPDSAFSEHLYNADYLKIDPEADGPRPAANARLVAEAFSIVRERISILDYGGGSGRLAEELRARGFSAETYDPFSQHCHKPQKHFDLITSFEVLEHLPDPRSTVASIASLLKTQEADGEDGLLLFSTLLQPDDILQTGVNWWYAAPRNGHCSLYSASSLGRLFASAGMQVASSGAALHLAYRRVPSFAGHLRIGLAQSHTTTTPS